MIDMYPDTLILERYWNSKFYLIYAYSIRSLCTGFLISCLYTMNIDTPIFEIAEKDLHSSSFLYQDSMTLKIVTVNFGLFFETEKCVFF